MGEPNKSCRYCKYCDRTEIDGWPTLYRCFGQKDAPRIEPTETCDAWTPREVITIKKEKHHTFTIDKDEGALARGVFAAKSFYDEAYSWRDDLLKIMQRQVNYFDNKRIDEIANHFEVDCSEIREFLKWRIRRKNAATNYDRVVNMTPEELARFLGETAAKWCDFEDKTEEETKHFREWLDEEVADA